MFFFPSYRDSDLYLPLYYNNNNNNLLHLYSAFQDTQSALHTRGNLLNHMTDRLERFDLKISKLDLLKKKRHLHLGCPWGKLIDTKF